jgi:predicted RNA-binding protein (TIGR00451 family)
MVVTYRNPNQSEKTQMNRALNRWAVFEALSKECYLIQEKQEMENKSNIIISKLRTVCLVTPSLARVALQTNPQHAGLAIGYLKKQFVPSMAGADLFARLAAKDKKKYYVVVNEKAEKLVLYGRDVLASSIDHISPELSENDMVIILNTKHEAIGIGKIRYSGSLILKQNNKVAISTLLDAGYYLREEQ